MWPRRHGAFRVTNSNAAETRISFKNPWLPQTSSHPTAFPSHSKSDPFALILIEAFVWLAHPNTACKRCVTHLCVWDPYLQQMLLRQRGWKLKYNMEWKGMMAMNGKHCCNATTVIQPWKNFFWGVNLAAANVVNSSNAGYKLQDLMIQSEEIERNDNSDKEAICFGQHRREYAKKYPHNHYLLSHASRPSRSAKLPFCGTSRRNVAPHLSLIQVAGWRNASEMFPPAWRLI